MKEPTWVLPELALAVHQILIAEHGGLAGLRDQDLIESALTQPRQLYSYKEAESIPEVAAAYCYGIARNHPFLEGNKRSALTLAGVFLDINDFVLNATEAEAVVIIEQLAAGKVKEEDLAAWFVANSDKANR
jgi:death-on-curing protein